MTQVSLRLVSTRIMLASLLGLVLGWGAVAVGQDASFQGWKRLFLAQQYKQAQAIAEVQYRAAKAGGNLGQIADWSLALARSDKEMGRFDRAEGLFLEGIAFCRKTMGPENEVTVNATVDLGSFYLKTGKIDDADRLIRDGLAALQRARPQKAVSIGHAQDLLAQCCEQRGQFIEAERLTKQAMANFRIALGPGHHNTLSMLLNLGQGYREQARNEDAEAVLKQLLAECRKYLQPDDPIVATALESLAGTAGYFNRFEEAESLYRKAADIVSKNYGTDHLELARIYLQLGDLLRARGQTADADALFRKSLAIYEKAYGRNSVTTTDVLLRMAISHARRKEYREALAILDHCIAIRDKQGARPHLRFQAYQTHAIYAAVSGQLERAMDDLHKAMELADEARGLVGGSSRDRAVYFGGFAKAYEQVVGIQSDLPAKPDMSEVFAAMERFHARGLIDEMQLFGADPDRGRPPGEVEAFKRNEAEIRTRISALETRVNNEKDDAKAEALIIELGRANNQLYQHFRDVQESSPVYQRLVNQKAKLPNLEDVQQRLLKPGDMLVEYLLGDICGFGAVVTQNSAELLNFGFNADEAKVMEVDLGSLTTDRARRTFLNKAGTGLIQQLANPNVPVPVAKLQVMWNTVLALPSVQKALTDGTIKRLIVIPDGPLALLPFEALVTGVGPNGPVYFLESGPPVVYAPSAAVLFNQLKQPVAPHKGTDQILTLGDPAYGVHAPGVPAPAEPAGSARSRYRLAGGALPQLPYSGWETQWVAKAFRDAGNPTLMLTGAAATERAVRDAAPGRRIIHLACHGLVSEDPENLFGSLAFAPGPRADVADDDGFLQLVEIYNLDLKSCDLAVLSACQTNYGPEQTGEGTLALTRGFLVAGARRVVASNWVVDDEAAASLVSIMCTNLAKAEKAGQAPDYAQSLREAKRWVRQQNKWKAPYFWANLVLVGPP